MHSVNRSIHPPALRILVSAVALTSTFTAEAQGTAMDEVAIEPISVTASRLPDPPPISRSVIDVEQIDVQHSVGLLDLLRVTPGISTTQPGGPGGVSEVFLRSAESNFTVVLIDGVRVNDPSNPRGGGYDFSTLNTDEVERIEIARGALSAVHGSDAMAGVINIVTRRPSEEPAAQVRVEGGSDDFQRASALLSGALATNTRGALKASYADFGDAVSGSTQQLASVQGDLDFGSADAGIGSVVSGARYAERDRTSFADASGGPLFATSSQLEDAHAEETSAWAHATRTFNETWSMNVTGTFFSRDEQVITPAIAPGIFEGVPASVSVSRFRRSQLTVSQLWQASEALQMGAGIDLQFEKGERDGELDLGFARLPSDFDMDRRVRAAYAEASYRFVQGIALYGAARVDDTDDASARGSSSVSASYTHPHSGLIAHVSWSSGHKQPSFYSLGDTLVGNPELRVETSETFEAGLRMPFVEQRVQVAITAFRSDYENLIDFDFNTFRLVNRSRARIDGVEASSSIELARGLNLRAHATLSDIELDTSDSTLLYRPESYGGVQATWEPMIGWALQANAQIVGKREGSSVPTGPRTLNGYERLDLALSREMSSNTTLFAALDNVLDEDYQEAVGFPSVGRQVRVGAALSF